MDTLTPISPIEVIEPVNTPVNQQAQQSEKEKCLELNAGYNPPTREYLSEHLFETELFIINDKIEDDIMNQQNLTLTLDGWTSGHYQSIWNFVIFTSSRKEYLY
ncbi:unnamed protein product [Rhizophagus irregularis]|nr:unnamed protein product [Rhizophagus irregularis]